MLGMAIRETQILSFLAAASAVGVCAAAYALTRKQPSFEETEHNRRLALMKGGRLTTATVLDISDLSPEESGRPMGLQLILYQYDISGVVYQCSQDVTLLKNVVNIYDIRLGFPALVRYDQHNPANSIIVAENWSGLRDTAVSVPLHPAPRAMRHAWR
jgi:hypothetical protein